MTQLLNNIWFDALVLWPVFVILCAGLNMLLQGAFSWSELVIDYLVGIAIGVCMFYGTANHASPVAKFFLVFSDGLPGLLAVVGIKALQRRDMLFGVSMATIGGSVLMAGLLDLAALSIGKKRSVAGGLFSILILVFKLPFSLFTTGVGYLLWLVGLFASFGRDNAQVGFLGGVPYVEWDSTSGREATTFGAAVMVWRGPISNVLKHELYHTRQYMFLHDWLIPFYPLAGIWGLISSAIADKPGGFWNAQADEEVGNPLERVAWASTKGEASS
jgi:hypothetical protein